MGQVHWMRQEHLKMNTHFEGLVFKKSQGNYLVQESGRVVRCSISSLLRRELVYPTADPSSLRPVVVAVREIHTVDPVAVGDRVRFVRVFAAYR
jgi:hypothetical protein